MPCKILSHSTTIFTMLGKVSSLLKELTCSPYHQDETFIFGSHHAHDGLTKSKCLFPPHALAICIFIHPPVQLTCVCAQLVLIPELVITF